MKVRWAIRMTGAEGKEGKGKRKKEKKTRNTAEGSAVKKGTNRMDGNNDRINHPTFPTIRPAH